MGRATKPVHDRPCRVSHALAFRRCRFKLFRSARATARVGSGSRRDESGCFCARLALALVDIIEKGD